MTDDADNTPAKTPGHATGRAAVPAHVSPTFAGLRLGATTLHALELMAYEGCSMRHAAQRAGIRTDSLGRAFNRPDVRTRYNQIVSDIKQNAAHQAYLRLNHLSETAESEHVRADANKWVAGVGNIAPLKRVEGKFTHEHSFKGFGFADYDEGDTVDVTPDPDCTSSDQDD